MTLKDTINEEIKTAMKARDQGTLRALRAIKSAILLAETAEGHALGTPLTPEEDLKLLTKQAKQRKDSIEQFRAKGREDLVAIEAEELAVIERFLPKQLDPQELEAEIRAIIAESGATGAKDMGKVMGLASQKLAGRADGKTISTIVKNLLSN